MLSYLTVPITKFLRLFYSHKLLSVVDVTDHCVLLLPYFNDLVGRAALLWFAFCTVVWLWLSLMLWPSWIWPSYRPPCGRHGLLLGPLSFVAVIAVAVMVCGR